VILGPKRDCLIGFFYNLKNLQVQKYNITYFLFLIVFVSSHFMFYYSSKKMLQMKGREMKKEKKSKISKITHLSLQF
jgi:hypothetical protein